MLLKAEEMLMIGSCHFPLAQQVQLRAMGLNGSSPVSVPWQTLGGVRREGSIGCGGEQVSWQGEGIILSGTFFLEEENFSVGVFCPLFKCKAVSLCFKGHLGLS